MQKIVSIKCPKCNRYGKDKFGFQKYLCINCKHQFETDSHTYRPNKNYSHCPICRNATFF